MRLFEGTPFDIPPTCDLCGLLESECECEKSELPVVKVRPPEKQRPKIRVEKRKRGKMVTVVGNLDPSGTHLVDLLKQLKNRCGAGGTVEDNNIVLQGVHSERLHSILGELGYRVSNK